MSWARSVLAWSLPAVMLGGVSLAAVRLAEPHDEPGIVERMSPLERGTTWVFATETNGEPTGLQTAQVVGGGLMADGRPTVLVERHYEDFLGRGQPATTFDYLAIRRGRLLFIGARTADGFDEQIPPTPALVPPLREDQTWSFEGLSGDASQTQTSTVEEIAPREVLGRTIPGCRRVTSDTTYTLEDGTENRVEAEGWTCPGVGQVSSREELVGGDLVFEQELEAFRSADLSLGEVPDEPEEGGVPERGESPGVDPARTSAAPGELRLDALAWSETRKAALDFVPVGRDGLLVLVEEDGWVSATDTDTGVVRWRVQVEGLVAAPPVLAGPLVLLGDSEKSLLALDAMTGRARWIARLPDLVASPPVPAGDRVIVAGEDRVVRAFDLRDGRVLWEQRFLDLITEPLALLDDRVLVGQLSGEVTAISVEDGQEIWSRSLETLLLSGPVARDGLVVAGDDQGLLYGFDADDGGSRWLLNPDGFVNHAAAIGPDALALFAGHKLEVRDPVDGSLRWSARVQRDPTGPPVIVGDEVVTLTTVGALQRFDLADGRTPGPTPLSGPAPSFEIGAELPLQFLDGNLVVVIEVAGPWPFGLVLAFPASASAEGDGVRPTGEIRPAPAPPIGHGILDEEGALVFSGADDRAWRVLPSGEPVELTRTGKDTPSFAIPAGDVVLTQREEQLVAIPESGGDPRWTFPMSEPFVGTAPLVVGDTVVVPIRGQGLAGVDLASGDPRWVETIPGQGTSSPALLPDGDVAYGVGSLVRIDPATGEVRWRVPGVDTFGPLGIGDGAITEVGFHENRPVLLSVEADTGEVRWEAPWQPSLLAGAAAGPGVVIAGDAAGQVAAFDAVSGDRRWSMDLRMPVAGTPLVLGDLVVVATLGRNEDVLQREFRFVFLDATDGRYRGSFEPTGVAHSLAGFSVSDDRLLIPAVTSQNAFFIVELGWP